jgi:diadenosine tetraphosphate (Ap4A) HIT family hydrolase
VPETPEQLFLRAKDALRTPPVEEWETWPFDGEIHPRELLPPLVEEKPRQGAGGVDCWRCNQPDDSHLWTSERWRVRGLGPAGVPVIVMLEPRRHYAEPGDLSDELAAECGVLLARVERAVRSVGQLGRVHVCRWDDGGEHLHWWFIGRPARLPQLTGSFVAIWDDVLPPLPEEDLARESGYRRGGAPGVGSRHGGFGTRPVALHRQRRVE